ncbi:hypothetical protein [Pseudanabaena sp. SR411]|uniref:sunset domain-containing protein n=1 Tax=Pseudanabaena sp. SR411 TaxID=1980935 RepID=UPI001C3D184A|nr:hypothetical protein [Pseudanabaena sp. SR411]
MILIFGNYFTLPLRAECRLISPAMNFVRGCNIKGNISVNTGSKLYHLPNMEDYAITNIDVIKGERWFCTEAEAIASGWRKAPR